MVWLCLICDWTSFKEKTSSYLILYFMILLLSMNVQFNSVLQSFSILFSYVQSIQVFSICFGFSQVFTADLPHHAPLGHRCLRLHRRCHHRGGRPCHHRYDLTRRTQRWCSRRMWKRDRKTSCFFSWSCFFSVEDCKSVKCSCARLEAFWWLYHWKEPKVPAILKTVNAVWLLFDEMHLLGTTFLTIPCQTWEDCRPQFLSMPRSFMYVHVHLMFICSICHSHVETLPGQHFWKAQLILCHAGPVVTARQRSAVTLAVPNSEHDRYTASNCRMTGPHHSSHFCFLDLVLESHCSSVWIFANSDETTENQWNSMKIFKGSYIQLL